MRPAWRRYIVFRIDKLAACMIYVMFRLLGRFFRSHHLANVLRSRANKARRHPNCKQILPVVIRWCVHDASNEQLERVIHWVTLCVDVFDASVIGWIWRIVAVLFDTVNSITMV